ncbi:hypothetical protein PVK06_011397 [Gossypium arboreum]|uniref:RNase H type-1 domain-containing protein n=1 Tax=Gossypium arboreum TaxID=29729 RepID=A0ABR0Q9I3_GOSAR|nr:hypothetical protein PVK06_011397 [Gossypium arboreum]
MRRSNDIEKYLGLPNLVGKKKRSSFQNLKDRIKKRVDSWSFRTLSQGGKEVFIKSVTARYRWQKGHGRKDNFRVRYHISNVNITMVVELIDENTRMWREDLIRTTFEPDDADKILRIPLASEAHPDMIFWRGEHSGEFAVRSTYKMLQNQSPTTYPIDSHNTAHSFYKQLWELQLPNKIKILAWKQRVALTAICPRCRTGTENLRHAFVGCPESEELWKELNLSWIRQSEFNECIEWLTWIFSNCTIAQRRSVICGIWVLWMDRNKNLHEGMAHSGKENARYVRYYLGELDGINERQISDAHKTDKWKALAQSTIKINFDAAFDDHNHQSASVVVVRNCKGEIKATKSYLHSMVTTTFEAEAIACYEAVLMGKEMGFSDILVEGDSRTIINKCMTKSRDKSHVSTYISNIHSEKSSFQNISFLFVRRSANQLAHIIATISLRNKEEIYLFDAVAGYATHQSELERPREPD